MARQPTDPSAIARASITRNCVSTSSSGPPHERGIAMPKTPDSFKALTSDCGRRCSRSISSPAAWISAAIAIAACTTAGSVGSAWPAGYVMRKTPLEGLRAPGTSPPAACSKSGDFEDVPLPLDFHLQIHNCQCVTDVMAMYRFYRNFQDGHAMLMDMTGFL